MNKNQSAKKGRAAARKSGTSVAEWIVAGVSCVALLSVLAYLVVGGLTTQDGVPRIVVLPMRTMAGNGGHVIEFSASNQGDKSVAAVEIKGELRNGEAVVEQSSVVLDYIPQNSERRGALTFTADPAGHELHLFAGGYVEP